MEQTIVTLTLTTMVSFLALLVGGDEILAVRFEQHDSTDEEEDDD